MIRWSDSGRIEVHAIAVVYRDGGNPNAHISPTFIARWSESASRGQMQNVRPRGWGHDARASIVPTMLLHFLRPWRSDGGGRAKQEARAESEAGARAESEARGQSREQRSERLPRMTVLPRLETIGKSRWAVRFLPTQRRKSGRQRLQPQADDFFDGPLRRVAADRDRWSFGRRRGFSVDDDRPRPTTMAT